MPSNVQNPRSIKSAENASPTYYWRAIQILAILFAAIGAYMHLTHVSTMHENDLFYSHLSSMERELTFRTECGFYYSYYKQLLMASTLLSAWNSLTHDPRSEVPRCLDPSNSNTSCPVLNAMERFNLYPELILAYIYRHASRLGLLSSDCYKVTRDIPSDPFGVAIDPQLIEAVLTNETLPSSLTYPINVNDTSVLSCVGSGEPSYFYINAVFLLSGLTLISLAWSGWCLSSTSASSSSSSSFSSGVFRLWAVLLPMAAYFYNHSEATRVQWVPALRENFAYPFFMLQQAWLLYAITRPASRESWLNSLTYVLLLLCFQLPWQFSQFTLATQIASLFAALCLTTSHAFDERLVCRVERLVHVHTFALLCSTVLQFGNRLLLTSGYLAGLVGVSLGLRALRWNAQRDPGSTLVKRLLHCILCPSICAVGTAIPCAFVLNLLFRTNVTTDHDGGHIFDLLWDKFLPGGAHRTFHTRLYTCAAEFDFIGWNSIKKSTTTGLLPVSAIVAISILVRTSYQLLWPPKRGKIDSGVWQSTSSSFASLFVVIQLSFFTLMAVLIMRLKLFWTTHLCLCLSLVTRREHWDWFDHLVARRRGGSHKQLVWLAHAAIAMLLAYMTVPGMKNLQAELDIRGQFSAYGDEALVTWFRSMPPKSQTHLNSTEHAWVISGPLSTLGSLRLMLPAAPPYPSTQSLPISVGFAFTNHPHYENAQLRKRTVLAYSIYSRRTVSEVHHIYRDRIKADFVIVDTPSCYPRRGCSNPELYDLVDPHLANKPSLCDELLSPDVLRKGQTPVSWIRYFKVVYVEHDSGRVVLLVRP